MLPIHDIAKVVQYPRSMNASLRPGLWLLFALSAIGAAIYLALPPPPLQRPDPAARLWAWIPKDAAIVMTANLRSGASGPLLRLLEKNHIQVVDTSSSPCSTLKKLTDLAVWFERPRLDSFAVVAIGDVTEDELWQCAKDTIERRGGRPTRHRDGRFVLVGDSSHRNAEVSIALLRSGGAMVVGTDEQRTRMWAAHRGRTASMNEAVFHRAVRKLLTTPRTAMVVSSTISPWVAKLLRRLAPGASSQQIEQVQAVGLSLAFTGDEAHIAMGLVCRTQQGCQRLQETIRARLRLVGALLALRGRSDEGTLLGSVEPGAGGKQRSGGQALLVASIESRRLEKIVRTLVARRRETERREGYERGKVPGRATKNKHPRSNKVH